MLGVVAHFQIMIWVIQLLQTQFRLILLLQKSGISAGTGGREFNIRSIERARSTSGGVQITARLTFKALDRP